MYTRAQRLYETLNQESYLSPHILPRPRLRRFSILREVLDLIVLIAAIYALVNLATVRFEVQGSSMEPTFSEAQFLILSRVSYLLGDLQHGDIVVFHNPNNTAEDYIKRIIGLPGDMVEIRDTLVYINGEQLIEPYIRETCHPAQCPDSIWELGSDEYFVMGDNRNGSHDSRAFGPIKHHAIIGEVMVRYWPPADWGFVSRINYPVELEK